MNRQLFSIQLTYTGRFLPAARSYLRCLLTSIFFLFFHISSWSQLPEGFRATGQFDEQEMTIKDCWKNVTIAINAPASFKPNGKTYLIFYALPNGNSIEWTKGKKFRKDDDWHFYIQHIAAQTRYVRSLDKKNTYIITYLMANQKSWPAWKQSTTDSLNIIKKIVDSITTIFAGRHPRIILNGHSGGGSFIFGYLDAVEDIPGNVERIAFLDSDYGYEESRHLAKLVNWLKQSSEKKLLVLAYNDSLVIYNGKPLVSPTGGTWYRSRLMQRNLSGNFHFTTQQDITFTRHTALNGRIKFILKENAGGLIFHTEQVEKNGFILSILSATKFDRKKYFTYFGNRAYEKFISD